LIVRDILLDGIGGTLPAIAAMRFALGSFFVLSGIHKLINKERHRTFVETLRALGIPLIDILQWFVPGVEFFGGLGVAFGFLTPLTAPGLLVILSGSPVDELSNGDCELQKRSTGQIVSTIGSTSRKRCTR
jgi:DoxX